MEIIGSVIIVLLILGYIQDTLSARILTVFPMPFHEQQQIYLPLINVLSERGHQIVVISPESFESMDAGKDSLSTDTSLFDTTTNNGLHENTSNTNTSGNIRHIDISFVHGLKVLEKLKSNDGLSGSEMLKTVFDVMRNVAEAELKSMAIHELLHNNEEHFDAVIVDWSGVALMNAFAYHFKAPLIGLSSGGAFINSHEAMGNPTHPVAYANFLLPFTNGLNLIQRIGSVIHSIWYRYLYYVDELPKQNELAKQYFGDDIPDVSELEQSSSLLLINAYRELGNVRPVGPSTVYLGGLHATHTKRSIPNHLQWFLDETESNVVYINIGNALGQMEWYNRMGKLIYALELLNYDIIWNAPTTLAVNFSSIRCLGDSNLPQEEILAHPKVKLFITMGGQRNIEDAVHHAVPIFGISFSGSIEHYLKQVIRYDAGQVSVIDFESHETVYEKLFELTENNRYEQQMQKLRMIIMDQPMDSMERAVWWIEYVIRNKGTDHLNSPLKTISWIQYMMLDVLITVLLITLIIVSAILYIIYRLIKYSKSLPFEMVTRGSKCKVL